MLNNVPAATNWLCSARLGRMLRTNNNADKNRKSKNEYSPGRTGFVWPTSDHSYRAHEHSMNLLLIVFKYATNARRCLGSWNPELQVGAYPKCFSV